MILLTSSALLPWHDKDSALGLFGLVGFYKAKAMSCVMWCSEVFL